ncbi:MAG: dephospho-CoA kinase [Clostridiaceae bacterium]|nr:dephospho-CoA kinase [Clostridiaceae bacterium]
MIQSKETGSMRVIGLTGGIATGKSTVSKILKNLGAVIIDADQVARQIVEKETPALKEIIDYFGKDILLDNGELNRKKLGEIVFSNPSQLKKLNAITHPRISQEIQNQINNYKQSEKNNAIIIDAPLLIETDLKNVVDEIWLVTLPKEKQIQRLIDRDHLTHEEIKGRLDSQMSQEEKISYAHQVIDNSGSIEELEQQVIRLWEIIH